MAYECVVRRRERLGMSIAACGLMRWSDEIKAYLFEWPVPENFTPRDVVVVQIDIFEQDEMIAEHRCLRFVSAGQIFPISYPGGGLDDGEGEAPEPDPDPATAIDLDALLRELVTVPVGVR